MSFLKDTKAFTLVELILVIAIIVLIAGAVFVSLNPSKRLGDAKDLVRANNAIVIEEAIHRFISDNAIIPTTLSFLTVDTPYMIVTEGGDDMGTADCATLDQAIDKVDLADDLVNYIANIPVDVDAVGDDTGYYIVRKGNNFYCKPCNAYGDTYEVVPYVYNWVETRPGGDIDLSWNAGDSDYDGSSLIMSVRGGRLYTSNDYGVTWEERRPGGIDADRNWYSVSSDSDGSSFIAAVQNGRLYTSNDYGVTWEERRPGGIDADRDWRAVAISSDGTWMIAAAYNSRIYTSSDSGVNWSEVQPLGNNNANWNILTADSDGSNIIVGNNARLYKTNDYGATWDEARPDGDVNKSWYVIESDSDGSNIIVASFFQRIYTSSDYGETWVIRYDLTSNGWSGLASDADGSHLVVGRLGDELAVSPDYGETWIEVLPDGSSHRNWRLATSNHDGSQIVVGMNGGTPSRLYIGTAQ